mgnify:CR=1 FL=1
MCMCTKGKIGCEPCIKKIDDVMALFADDGEDMPPAKVVQVYAHDPYTDRTMAIIYCLPANTGKIMRMMQELYPYTIDSYGVLY